MREDAPTRRASAESGYALLMVFLMAGIVALMLYQQLPRVAFESEREKEQLLIDRGEQYTRAIQLYYLANNRQYPTSLDDLEKKEKRFLRRRFVDPYTGKDEWRIIHTNGGFLTDSLVQKPPTDSKTTNASDLASNNSTSSTDPNNPANQQPQVNAAVLQRPSDRPLTPPPGFTPPVANQDGTFQQQANTPLPPITLLPQPGQGQGQAGLPPITLQPTNQGGLPPITLAPVGAANGQQVPGQLPGQIPGQIPGQNPNQGIPIQGQPNFPGQQNTAGIQNGLPPEFPGTPGVPGQQPGTPGSAFGQPATTGPAGTAPNAAVAAINQILTTPRQTPTATPTVTNSNQVGGIAGVASTHTGPSIKVYKDQTLYQKWEFVFSPTASVVSGAGAPAAIPGQGTGAPPQSGAQPGANQSNPFGNSFSNGQSNTGAGTTR